MTSETQADQAGKRPARRAATVRTRQAPKKANSTVEPVATPPTPVTPQVDPKPPRATLAGFVLAFGILLFIGSQVVSQFQIHTSLGWQVQLLKRQGAALENDIQRLQMAEIEGQKLLSQAESVSQSYQALLKDLLKLSATDPEAMAVVSRFQIRNLADPRANSAGETPR